jgi:hypothetical protein
LRYNGPMILSRRLRVFVLPALIVALVVAAVVLWQCSRGHEGMPVTPETSPLPAPTTIAEASSSSSRFSWTAALFWVVLGGLLALGIAFLILRHHKNTQ